MKRGFLNRRRQELTKTTEEKCKIVLPSPEPHKQLSSPDMSAETVNNTLDPSDTKASLDKTTAAAEEMEEIITVSRALPDEIIFEILTRLPVKSLCRLRCVSKLWNSTISDRRFVKSHHDRSSTRPDGTALLITFPDLNKEARFMYALDQKRNPDAVYQLNLCSINAVTVSKSLHGLICLEEDDDDVIKICNPSTREFITLPPHVAKSKTSSSSRLKSWSTPLGETSFGYDPINDQHKVLNTYFTPTRKNQMNTVHRVFVLGGGNSWRIVDGRPHFPNKNDFVCVSGSIYYRAFTSMVNNRAQGDERLVQFDVNLETFRFIKLPSGASNLIPFTSALIQFDGHLGVVDYEHLIDKNTMDIWVLLEDSLKPNWVRKTFAFSSKSAAWTDFRQESEFFLAGTIHTGEIIIAPYTLKKPFYLFYLDLKNASVKGFQFRSLPGSRLRMSGIFYNITVTDHVENILSLRGGH